ncbi:TMV resistance protein N-like isoform X2 [Senna tora]|uniref:TMV resistance protein N-like isoform X2 n=1 Tax=Senna tora TaxID=362788 RepID=A0A834WMR0_9FABA|nr:TMV resistance protein N-like isoform X2 [Senna tora]
MSGVPCLRELRLRDCDNLIEIDESVGFLKHLVVLTASKCAKLRSFLPSMWLPSLKTLELQDCPRLEHFPDIVGEMKKPLHLSLWNIGIKELPQSIGNLIGLESIGMALCTSLRDIPCNFFMLPKIELLSFDRSAQLVVESFKSLEVPENNFVSLPACIKESVNLRTLEVNECSKLQEIPELPSNIQRVYAKYCPRLTSETSSMLWSQACKEEYKLQVLIMPELKIPDWFDHRCEGDTISFRARQKFPIVVVAFIFKKEKRVCEIPVLYKKENEMRLWAWPFYYQTAMIRLYVNGVELKSSGWNWFQIAEYHVLVCDLRALFKAKEWPVLDTFLEHDWNHVEVKCEIMHNEDQSYGISECGAYVYKQQTNIDDIQFHCPNQSTGNDRLRSFS